MQCGLLGVSRSSCYYQPAGPSGQEVAIKHRLDELYTAWPFYGSRRMTAHLQREGYPVNRKRVQRYLRQMGLRGLCPGPNLSRRRQSAGVFPYLLREVQIVRPDQVWGLDLTYIRLQGGWLYLVAVMDWYSRYVLSWELDQSRALPFVLVTMQRALTQAVPEICNSDQGGQFTNSQWIALLQQAGVRISMAGPGRARDNIFVERLWRTVKYEEVYLQDYGSPREARQGLARYFEFYNYQRLHQALGYRTPWEAYRGGDRPAPHGGQQQGAPLGLSAPPPGPDRTLTEALCLS